MSGVLADQGIYYDRDNFFQSRIENVEARYTADIQGIYHTLYEGISLKNDQDKYIMEDDTTFYDKTVRDFFVEKWTRKLNCLKTVEDGYLKDENIDQPNELALNYSYQLINELAKGNIFPDKLSTSVEEGICVKFKNKRKILYFEIYNTGELGYIIEDLSSHKTIENEDVFSIDEIVKKINEFILN
jgi:uncharacterized protein YfkK (UPF0435 family)